MSSYRLISWNVNGIRAVAKKNVYADKTFTEWLKYEQPDVLAIQETKAHPEQLDMTLLKPEGFNSYWSWAEKKGYSGVSMYIKESIKPVETFRGMGIPDFDSEGRIISAEFPEFVFFNIYFPNGRRDEDRLKYKLDFYDSFLEHIENVRADGKEVIFCGDLNTAHKPIDLSNPEENQTVSGFLPVERKWIDKVVKKGYLDSFRIFSNAPNNYTWWDYRTRSRDRNIGWRLDYFFISEGLKKNIRSARILNDVYGSDHCPVDITLEF